MQNKPFHSHLSQLSIDQQKIYHKKCSGCRENVMVHYKGGLWVKGVEYGGGGHDLVINYDKKLFYNTFFYLNFFLFYYYLTVISYILTT